MCWEEHVGGCVPMTRRGGVLYQADYDGPA